MVPRVYPMVIGTNFQDLDAQLVPEDTWALHEGHLSREGMMIAAAYANAAYTHQRFSNLGLRRVAVDTLKPSGFLENDDVDMQLLA